MPGLTPAQLAHLDQRHAGAAVELDQTVAQHRAVLAEHGPQLATAILATHLLECTRSVAAGFAAHAITRLAQRATVDKTVTPPAKPRVITWDWGQQPPLDQLRDALTAGLIHLYEVDTGGDEYGLVLAAAPMGPAAVAAAYDRRHDEATGR